MLTFLVSKEENRSKKALKEQGFLNHSEEWGSDFSYIKSDRA